MSNVVTIRNSLESYGSILIWNQSDRETVIRIGMAAQIDVESGNVFVIEQADIGDPLSESNFYVSTTSGIYDVTPRKNYPGYGNNCSPFLVIKANQGGEVTVVCQN